MFLFFLCSFYLLVLETLKRITNWFINRLFVQLIDKLFFVNFLLGMNWIGFHFDILFDFVVLLIILVKFSDELRSQLVFKEFSISHSCEFLAELKVFWVAVMIALSIKSSIFRFIQSIFLSQIILSLKKSCLCTFNFSFIFYFGLSNFTTVCLNVSFVVGSPRVHFCIHFIFLRLKISFLFF